MLSTRHVRSNDKQFLICFFIAMYVKGSKKRFSAHVATQRILQIVQGFPFSKACLTQIHIFDIIKRLVLCLHLCKITIS